MMVTARDASMTRASRLSDTTPPRVGFTFLMTWRPSRDTNTSLMNPWPSRPGWCRTFFGQARAEAGARSAPAGTTSAATRASASASDTACRCMVGGSEQEACQPSPAAPRPAFAGIARAGG